MLEFGTAREPREGQRLAQGNASNHSLTHFLFGVSPSWGGGTGDTINPTSGVRAASGRPLKARESLVMASQSEVTDGTHVFRPYLPSSPPHPAPGGLGVSGGEDCGVSVQALSPEVMNVEKRSDSGPHPGHLRSVVTGGDGGGALEGSRLRLEWCQLDAAPWPQVSSDWSQLSPSDLPSQPHTPQAISLQSVSQCSSLVTLLL